MTNFERHEYSALFEPFDMDGVEWTEFLDSIAKKGVMNAIVLFEGKILDGWNRYRAASELNRQGGEVSFKTIDFQGDNEGAWEYVVACNMRRRSLTNSDKIRILMAKNAKTIEGKTVREIATEANIDKTTAHKVKKVNEKASDEIKQAVAKGELSIHKANELISWGGENSKVDYEKEYNDLSYEYSIVLDKLASYEKEKGSEISELHNTIEHERKEKEVYQAQNAELAKRLHGVNSVIKTLCKELDCEGKEIIAKVKKLKTNVRG